MLKAELLVVRDTMTGRFHRAYRIEGRVCEDTRCKIGTPQIITVLPSDMPRALLCRMCYPGA